MKNQGSNLQTAVSTSVAALGLLLTTSCSKLDALEQQSGKTQERLSRIEEKLGESIDSGRYQVVVANQNGGGTAVFLVDTDTGATWSLLPPQGQLGNGIWADIPRVTRGTEYWQQILSQTSQPVPQPAPTTTPAPASTSAPAAAVPTAPRR